MKKGRGKKKKQYNEKQIEKLKSDSIRLAILYRSLYILKVKFERYKKEVNKVFDKYYGGEKKNLESCDHRVIKTSNFFPLVKDVFDEMKITIPKIINPSDIFYFDIFNFDPNDPSHTESIKLMEKIVLNRNNLEKYNKIYYNRKIKPLVEAFLKNKDNDDVTECYKITEYDRKGRVVHTCDELLEMMGYKEGYKGLRKNPKDEYDSYMKKGDVLFVDTLPILIADFLQANPDFVVINLDLEDKELINKLKQLYDDDILKKIREEEEKNKKNAKVVEEKAPEVELSEDQKKLKELYDKKMKLEKTLKLYQDLLNQKKQNGESYKYILDFIDKLKAELDKINNEIKELLKKMNGNTNEGEQGNEILPPLKGKVDETDLRMREIFAFYCSQHRAPASYPTFAQISYKVNHMNISEFCKFCTDFKIPLDIDKLMEIYNKREPINENSEINYNEFKMILYKISLFLNENKKRKLIKKIDKLKKKIDGENVSSDSDENENEEYEENEEKLEKRQNELNYLNKLNFKGAFGELQKYLEIDKPKKYRDKMKGFLIRYHDYQEKIEKYDLLTKEEIIKVQEKAEEFKKKREESQKERENKKEKRKKELFEIKKNGFIEQNKRLLRRIKEKEEKKTYMMLRNIKRKEDKKCLININKPTEDLKINLNNDDKKLLFIDDEEENSDEEILEKYGVPKNKKIIKKEDNKLNSSNDKNSENKETKNDSNNPNNTINNNENNVETVTNNNAMTTDNLSINTSNLNKTNDIKELKQNLKPKKKENIYFSKKENESKTEIDKNEKEKEDDKKAEEEKKENEKEKKKENNKVIELKKENKKNEKAKKNNNQINIVNNNNDILEKNNDIKTIKEEGIYLTEPDINKFRKRTIPAKASSPPNSLTKQIQIKHRMGSNSLGIRNKIKFDLIPTNNKIKENKEDKHISMSFKKDHNNNNLNNNNNQSADLINQNKSYDKISLQTNNINNRNINGYYNKKNKLTNTKNTLLNSIKKNPINSMDNKRNITNNNIIQLPSVNSSVTPFTPSKQNENVLKESNMNIKPVITESNVIVLPEIKSPKSSFDIMNRRDNSLDNNRYLLFQKNNSSKGPTTNKSIKFNNNVIMLSEVKNKGYDNKVIELKSSKNDKNSKKRKKK